MVSREIVLQTVRRMYESGVDDETIMATLRDVGVEESDILGILAEAKGPKAALKKPAAPEPVRIATPEEIAKKTAERVGRHVRDLHEEQALRAETLHAAVEEHGEELRKVSKRVEDLHEAVAPSGVQNAQIAAVQKKLTELERDIAEIKGATVALQSLLKRVLETNRQILQKGAKK